MAITQHDGMLNTLYQDLLERYSNAKSRVEYEESIKKTSDFIKKNKDVLMQKDTNASSMVAYTPYPDYDNQRFNEVIFNKKEFHRNFKQGSASSRKTQLDFDEVSKSKCSQTHFSLTPNQKFIKNFMSPLTPYNGILLFHSVGVGKTCTAISIAEQYHQLYAKPVLVILSPALIDNFKKQLFDISKYNIEFNQSSLCTGTTYPDLVLDKTLMKPEQLEKVVTKIINQRYKFMGYKKLVSIFDQTREKITKQEKDTSKHDKMFYERIKDFFSNRLIIVDEAHNLRNSSEKGSKQTAQVFWNLLKYTENVKLVLLTATPMFNNANEIIWLLNLLLTNDKRPNLRSADVFDKNGNLTSSGKDVLVRASRGYVSYMRGENPFTFPFRLYPTINDDVRVIKSFPSYDMSKQKIQSEDKIRFLELVGSSMSAYQKRVYDLFKNTAVREDLDGVDGDMDGEGETDDDKVSNDLQSVFQVSNVVYPVDNLSDASDVQKTFGNNGFNNTFVNSAKKGVKYRYSPSCLAKYGEVLRYENLDIYAPKIKAIIDSIKNSKGIVFVYSNYYGAGIKPLAIALEHIGYVKYNSSNITGENITVDIDNRASSRPAYVILSRNNDLSPNNEREIEVVKSKENKDGSIVKVVIASQIATEGIDFKRIREVHILEPWYNLNKCEQIVGRAVRTCSHIDMPKEERNVTIYYHVATYNDKEESADIRKYRIAEKKQKRITEIEKLLKETAFDCNLNRDSLMYTAKDLNMSFTIETSQGKKVHDYIVGDKDYSYVCNYEKCNLQCKPQLDIEKLGQVNSSTFDSRFILNDVEQYKRYIAELYTGTRKALSYERIADMLNRVFAKTYQLVDEEVLQYALQSMLDDKTTLFDENNARGFLIYRSNKYIFQRALATDKRMTVTERETPTSLQSRLRLNVSVLKDVIANDTHTQLSSSKGSATAAMAANVSKSSVNIDNVLEHVLQQSEEITNAFKNQGLDMKKYSKYIIDHLIDHLPCKAYVRLMEEIAQSYNTNTNVNKDAKNSDVVKACLLSLMDAGILLFEKEKLSHFYNYFDGELYCLRNGSDFKKCTPLEYNKIASKAHVFKTSMTSELEDSVKGHIDIASSNGACSFKVRDNPKSSGYVCLKTSSLSLNDLKERIKGYDASFVLTNCIKKDLCLLYEILLRSQGRKVFKRSVTKKLRQT